MQVGPLILTRHKVISPEESDIYFAFLLDYLDGTAEARPPEIAEIREPTFEEALRAPWISELSRLAIRLAGEKTLGWPRSKWPGGEVPGLLSETFHPGESR